MRRIWPAGNELWRAEFLKWIGDPRDGEQEQLSRWLHGHDLPAGTIDTLPHQILLRALPRGADRIPPVTRLSQMAAVALRQADGSDDDDNNGFLYNLLYVAAGLSQPDELCQALDKFYDRTDLRDRWYRGLRLTVALWLALMWNQANGRWFDKVWKPMERGEGDRKVAGSWVDGIDGMFKMPRGSADVGAELAWALKEYDPGDGASNAAWDEYYGNLDYIRNAGNLSYDLLWEAMQASGCSTKALNWNLAPMSRHLAAKFKIPEEDVASIASSCVEEVQSRRDGRTLRFAHCSTVTAVAYMAARIEALALRIDQ